MITLHLYGSLKEDFGSEFVLDAHSPIEAIRILEANFPGRFLKSFAVGGFYVVRGKDMETGISDVEDTLLFEMDEDVHIAPEIEGSGGLFKAILGAVIIVAAVVAAAYTGGTSLTVLGMTMSYGSIALFGAALMIGGIAEMLTPTPDLSIGAMTSVDPKNSHVFNGAENIVAQGVPVPVVYGEVETGSVTIAASLTVEDVSSTITSSVLAFAGETEDTP